MSEKEFVEWLRAFILALSLDSRNRPRKPAYNIGRGHLKLILEKLEQVK